MRKKDKMNKQRRPSCRKAAPMSVGLSVLHTFSSLGINKRPTASVDTLELARREGDTMTKKMAEQQREYCQ